MSNLIDKAKSAILHHGTTGFEEIEEVNLYANEDDDVPIVGGFAVHIDELPEPVIFQGNGAEDMARAYVAMRRVIPEVIEQFEKRAADIERLREALDDILCIPYHSDVGSPREAFPRAEIIAHDALEGK